MKASIISVGDRFQADCLWKKGEPKLVYNKANALQRLLWLQRHPLYQSLYYPVYKQTLTEYLSKNFIESVPEAVTKSTESLFLSAL